MAVTAAIPRGDTVANINFYHPPKDGSKPWNFVEPPTDGSPRRNFEYLPRETPVSDARGREADFTLDRDAFQIVTGVPESKERDFTDDASIAANYYPEVERLLLDTIPGSNRVVIFDHTIRRADPAAPRGPVLNAHVDQTAESTVLRVRRHLPADEADALLRGRYRIVNVWRPLNKKPLESTPLAFASASSVSPDDFVPVEHRYPNGYTGETAGIRPNKNQKWWYLSGMTGDERILLECFDSESLKPGSDIVGRVPHTAFEHPDTKPNAEGRESIEVRALVFGP
jgi:hypothetical protein